MYLTLKLLHVAAAVMFLGNIATGLFWKAHADRTRDPRVIAHALEGIIRSDRLFTIPGVVLILIFGFGAAGVGHIPVFGTPWIFWSIVLFVISGIAFMAQVAPLQRRMLDLARAGQQPDTFDWTQYHILTRRWEIWGAVALITPTIAMALMVLKPV